MTAVTLRLPEPPIVTVGRPVARVSVGPLIQVSGGTSVPAARLLPTPLGDPGQVPVVNAEGDGTEWADVAGGSGEAPALRASYREASSTGTVATTDGTVVATTAVTQHLPAVADMLDTGETYREVQFFAAGGAMTVDVPSADALFGLDGALLSSVTIPTGQSARFGAFTSGSPDAWVLLSHSGRMADLYSVGLAVSCADYGTFLTDYSATIATVFLGGRVGVPVFALYDDMSLDRFVTTGTGCASRMTLTTADHAGKDVTAATMLDLSTFESTLGWSRMIISEDSGATYTVGVPDVGATIDLTKIPAHAMQIQFSAPLSAGLLGPLAPDGDGERAELLATTYQGKTIQPTEVFFNTGDPNDPTNGPWQITGTVEVGAICRRPTAIGSVPWENITADLMVKAANARETRAFGVIRIGPPYTKQATDVMYERAAGFPDNVESADGSIVPTATQGDVGLGHLDLVVDPANLDGAGLAEKLLASTGMSITIDEDDNLVFERTGDAVAIADVDGLVDALAAKVPTGRTFAGLDLSADRTVAAVMAALNLGVRPYGLAVGDYRLLTDDLGYGRTTGGGGGSAAAAANQVLFVPFYVPRTVKTDELQLDITTAASNGTLRMGIYDSVGGRPGNILAQGTVALTSNNMRTVTFTEVTLTPGHYFAAVGLQFDGTGTNPQFATPTSSTMGAPETTPTAGTGFAAYLKASGVSGAFANTPTVAITRGTVAVLPMVWLKVTGLP